MTCTNFFKVVFLIFVAVFLFIGRYSVSDASEKQIGLKSSTHSSQADLRKRTSGLVKIEEEFLKYNIGFWFLKQMGVVTLQCKRENSLFTITIDGCTTGLVDKVLHRHNIYKTIMEYDKEIGRLKPLSAYEKKIKGDEERVKITHYDYAKRVRKFTKWRNGVFRREKEINLNDDASYDDGITAFYNFRNESYGRVSDGAIFTIQTVHKESVSESRISVRSIENSDNVSRWKERILDVKLIAEITLDPDVIDSEEGKLDVLLTDDFVPIGFIARDVIGFGDLYGVLEQDE